jgi:hypothetical protein
MIVIPVDNEGFDPRPGEAGQLLAHENLSLEAPVLFIEEVAGQEDKVDPFLNGQGDQIGEGGKTGPPEALAQGRSCAAQALKGAVQMQICPVDKAKFPHLSFLPV